MLALLFALSCAVEAQKKPKPLPMPPLVSHEQPISNYACLFTEEANPAPDQHDYWNVVVFAEYGKERKRYWSKSLGTYVGTASVTSQNSESARSGSAIGGVAENFQFGEAGKKCSDWKQAVHELIQSAKANHP